LKHQFLTLNNSVQLLMGKVEFCVVCGKQLKNVGPNAVTCEGECRTKNNKDLIRQNNERIKRNRARSILTFLENQFHRGINIDTLIDNILSINVRNIPFEDFVVTAYYVSNKELCKTAISLRELQRAAMDWDAENGQIRSRSVQRRLIKRVSSIVQFVSLTQQASSIALVGETVKQAIADHDEHWREVFKNFMASVTDTVQIDEPSKMKSLTRMLGRVRRELTLPKIGYNKNAYKLLKDSINVEFCSINETVRASIRRLQETIQLDNTTIDEMISIYDDLKFSMVGKESSVIIGGLLYYVSERNHLEYSQDDIARLQRISTPSIRATFNIIASKKGDAINEVAVQVD